MREREREREKDGKKEREQKFGTVTILQEKQYTQMCSALKAF